MRIVPYVSFAALALACGGCSPGPARRIEVSNPYENVNWRTFSHHRADLHVHTLQSDGCHLPDEVVRAFHDAGFSILAITDHDTAPPNLCRMREASSPQAIAAGAFADQPTPYPDPRPPNFPADTTWPWSAYGAPSPGELEMLGIEGAELTCSYHINSFFNNYGAMQRCDPTTVGEQVLEVGRRGGLAVFNHPIRAKEPVNWYEQFYREHPALVGLEVAGDNVVDYNVALWDQLLGRLMPSRPIWGVGTSDVHLLASTRFSFTVFLLDELTTEKAKEAMRSGQFYSVAGPRTLNLSRRGEKRDGREAYDGAYPELHSIVVDRDAGTITIDAAGYDEIVWISAPSSSEPTGNAAVPWPSGAIVHRGPVFDYANGDATLRYVRAELVRRTDAGPVRLFINPIGLTRL